jgi:hypothetical protein
MDVSCPSLPPKIFVADKVRPNEQTTGYMAAHGCHFIECSLLILLISIEVCSARAQLVHRANHLV